MSRRREGMSNSPAASIQSILIDLHKLNFSRTLDDKLLEPRRVRTMGNPLLRPAQRLLKSGVIERLQQIIERTGFKARSAY